jgi:ribosomal protein S19E (S16A)
MKANGFEGIGLDAVLDSLANERRRGAIRTIASEGMVTKQEIAREVSGEERGKRYKRAYISLHQCHLPKLEEYGIVREVDEGYTFGPNGEEALDALRRLQCEDAGNESRLRNLLRPLNG